MKNKDTSINTSIESLYYYVIRKISHPDVIKLPKNLAQYKALKKCDPDLFMEYLELLVKTRSELEVMITENISYGSLITYKNIISHVNNIVNSFNEIERANRFWQNTYNQDMKIGGYDITQPKQEDSEIDDVVCDEIKEDINSLIKVVRFELRPSYRIIGDVLYLDEQESLEEDRISTPMELGNSTHVEDGNSAQAIQNDWSVWSVICGCNCFS